MTEIVNPNKDKKVKITNTGTGFRNHPVIPRSRKYTTGPDQDGCLIYDGTQCRSIQMRNVPDLGVTGTIRSNPGCDRRHTGPNNQAQHIQCAATGEWQDAGQTSSGNKCPAFIPEDGVDDRDTHGIAYFNDGNQNVSYNGRMRQCRRQSDWKISSAGIAENVCQLRWIMDRYGNLPNKKTCRSSVDGTNWRGGTQPTCNSSDGLTMSTLGNVNNVITDLNGQFTSEFRLPLRYPNGGLAEPLLTTFAGNDEYTGTDQISGNQSQFLTCTEDVWNVNPNDPDEKDISKIQGYFVNAANLVLPTKEVLDSNGISDPDLIDDLFATSGFWLGDYVYTSTNLNGEDIDFLDFDNPLYYNGLRDNGYSGGINFVSDISTGSIDDRFMEAFSKTFLGNVKTYLTTPDIVADSNIYPSIKSAVQFMCGTASYFGNGRKEECSAFFGGAIDSVCNGISKNDLVGEDTQWLKYACSCNMPIEEYGTNTPQQQQTIACDNTCLNGVGVFPQLIPSNGELEKEVCTQTICIISDVDISIQNSSVSGGISVGNLCGSSCEEGGCICYMDNISVTVLNSTVQGGITIGQECGTCYEVSNGNYDVVKEIQCDTGDLYGTQYSRLSSFNRWVTDNRYWLLPLFATLFAVSLAIGLVVLIIPRKATIENTPALNFQDLPDESGYTYQEMETMIDNTQSANENVLFEQSKSDLASSLDSLGMEETVTSPSRPDIPTPSANKINTPEPLTELDVTKGIDISNIPE